jgi:hypothetical protein
VYFCRNQSQIAGLQIRESVETSVADNKVNSENVAEVKSINLPRSRISLQCSFTRGNSAMRSKVCDRRRAIRRRSESHATFMAYGLTPVTMLQYPNVGFTAMLLKPASRSIEEISRPEYCSPSVQSSIVTLNAATGNGPVRSRLKSIS